MNLCKVCFENDFEANSATLRGLAFFCPFESRVNLRTVNLLKEEEEEDATK